MPRSSIPDVPRNLIASTAFLQESRRERTFQQPRSRARQFACHSANVVRQLLRILESDCPYCPTRGLKRILKTRCRSFPFFLVLSLGTPLTAFCGDASGVTVAKSCRIKAAEHVVLALNQSGIVESVPREGDWIEKGEKVIVLESEVARASLAAAEKEASNDVDVRLAECVRDAARLEHEQAVKVNDLVKGSVAVSDVRRRKLELDQSVLQVEQARYKQLLAGAKRDEAAAYLKTFHVVAPVSGSVHRILKQKGEAVRPGEPIAELVNSRKVRVEGYIDFPQRHDVRIGAMVHLRPEGQKNDLSGAPLVGKVIFIDVVAQSVTQQVRVSAEVENTDEVVVPGMLATMAVLRSNSSIADATR